MLFDRRDFLKYSFLFTLFNFIPKPLMSFNNKKFHKNKNSMEYANVDNLILRNDLNVFPIRTVLNNEPFELLDFAHVTDLHIVDEGNPLRAEELKVLGIDKLISKLADPLPTLFEFVSKDQDPYIAMTWNETVKSINKSYRQKPMDFLITTGDHTDTNLENEFRWAIEIADGYISDDYLNRTGKKDMVIFSPEGLVKELPWYATIGNHDVMYEGGLDKILFGAILKLKLVTAGEKSLNKDTEQLLNKLGKLGVSVLDNLLESLRKKGISAPDELLDMKEAIDLYKYSKTMPFWHGFANMPAPYEGYYSFTPKAFIHCIVLNTANYYPADEMPYQTFNRGVLDKRQFDWMKNEIEKNFDKLCIIFSHHPTQDPTKNWANEQSDISSDKFERTLFSYKNVIAHINGHTHVNSIKPVKKEGNGYWHITTSSICDFPQEWRRLTLYAFPDGTGSIKIHMFRHDNQDIFQIAYNDSNAKHEVRNGRDIDRNVELRFSLPAAVEKNIENYKNIYNGIGSF